MQDVGPWLVVLVLLFGGSLAFMFWVRRRGIE